MMLIGMKAQSSFNIINRKRVRRCMYYVQQRIVSSEQKDNKMLERRSNHS